MSARNGGRPVRDPGDADAVRRRQLLLFSVVAAVLLVAVAAWLGMGGGKERAPQGGIEAEIAGPDAAEKVWTRRSEARLGGIETQIREMQQEARTLTGAAHGDLSSEKVYVRFRTMTCAGPEPGTVIETDVAGFVAGSGKTGVRGPVVSREGALVEKAFLAGMVSGLGQGVAQAFQPQAVATGTGAAVANTGLGDIGRAGLGAGASSAGQKVADYMIRRAEQYQPVVQLQAGTKVTLVFLEGARIDGRARTSAQTQSAQQGN